MTSTDRSRNKIYASACVHEGLEYGGIFERDRCSMNHLHIMFKKQAAATRDAANDAAVRVTGSSTVIDTAK